MTPPKRKIIMASYSICALIFVSSIFQNLLHPMLSLLTFKIIVFLDPLNTSSYQLLRQSTIYFKQETESLPHYLKANW